MDKFNLGEIPRTSTGLIPSTFRRKQDALSTPKNWKLLPKQPRPELYPYRGDFINARNRKLAATKKAKLKATKQNITSKNNDVECSSTTAIPPCSPRESPTKGNVGWNANYKHNSFELTTDEQQKRAENKSRFTNFLRIEACKRHAREPDKNKTKTKPPQDDTKPSLPKKKKKPPVPRLSALARARAQGKTFEPNKATSTSVNHRCASSCSSKSKTTAKPYDEQARCVNKEEKKYLDFISKKKPSKASESSKVEAVSHHAATLKESASSIKQSKLEDDDSIFRLQLERIVRRASDLVIEKEKYATTTADFSPSTPSSSQFFSSTTGDTKSCIRVEAGTKKEDNMRSRRDRIDELEMRLARISGSSSTSSSATTTTEQPSEETSLYSGQLSSSVATEVFPREPIPMHPGPINRNSQDLQWTERYDYLHNGNGNGSSDSESDASSSESNSSEENVWQGQESESFDACAYPSLPLSVVEPSIFPMTTRQIEDEPLPRRGHVHGFLEGSVLDVAEDDFFSLFG